MKLKVLEPVNDRYGNTTSHGIFFISHFFLKKLSQEFIRLKYLASYFELNFYNRAATLFKMRVLPVPTTLSNTNLVS